MLRSVSLAKSKGVVVLLAAPLLLFIIFRTIPIFTTSGWQPYWYAGIGGLIQYYFSTLAGFLALIIALLTQHGLGANVNARSVLLTFGFFSLALLLITSSLGIPYLLLRQTLNPALIWSLFLSLPVSSVFFALGSVGWTAVTEKRLLARRWLLLAAVVISFMLFLLGVFNFATTIAQLSQTTALDRYLIAVFTIILLGWSAWRSHKFSLLDKNPLDEKLTITFILLAEAEVCLAFGLLGSLSWLLHLPLILAALVITLYPLLRNAVHYQREKRQRAELTQLIVHDLKSPLTIVISGLDLLGQGKLGDVSEKQRRLIGNLEHCSDEILRLVNDMLDVERMEEGFMPLYRANTDLLPFLREQVAELQILADKHQQQLDFHTAESLPTAYVDKELIERVVQNLVTNAFKFTPDGGKIVIEAITEKSSFILTIADSGPGIPARDRQRIFEKYAQLDATARRGKGLGLTFCKMVVEAHGGSLTVEDSPLGGALFRLVLPANAPAQESQTADLAPILTA
jgi:signal transduction histidine kinase